MKHCTTSRRPLSNKLRFEILERDEFRCRYCGASPDYDEQCVLEVDHITPVALGGSNHPDNLITSCEICNSGKRDRLPKVPLGVALVLSYVRSRGCEPVSPPSVYSLVGIAYDNGYCSKRMVTRMCDEASVGKCTTCFLADEYEQFAGDIDGD